MCLCKCFLNAAVVYIPGNYDIQDIDDGNPIEHLALK